MAEEGDNNRYEVIGRGTNDQVSHAPLLFSLRVQLGTSN